MYTAVGNLSRIAAFKFSPGADLYHSFVDLCNQYQIQNGIILSGFGSLGKVIIKNIIELPGVKFGAGYGEPIRFDGPLELLSTSGVICHDDNGILQPHIHIALSNGDGKGLGGHLCEGTQVKITVEGAIAEVEKINMRKLMDIERNIMVFRPEQL